MVKCTKNVGKVNLKGVKVTLDNKDMNKNFIQLSLTNLDNKDKAVIPIPLYTLVEWIHKIEQTFIINNPFQVEFENLEDDIMHNSIDINYYPETDSMIVVCLNNRTCDDQYSWTQFSLKREEILPLLTEYFSKYK